MQASVHVFSYPGINLPAIGMYSNVFSSASKSIHLFNKTGQLKHIYIASVASSS